MRLIVKAAAVAATVAVPLFVTACSTSSSATSGSSGSPSATAPSASPTSSSATSTAAGATGDPLASLTADQILSKATADFKAASSMHAAGSIGVSGASEKLNLTIATGKCAGTVTTSAGKVTVVELGSTTWVKVSSEYFKVNAGNSQYQGMTGFCIPAAIAGDLNISAASKGVTSVIGSQQALQLKEAGLGSVYVSESATPEFLRVNILTMNMDFSDYNAPVSISPPPASQVIGA